MELVEGKEKGREIPGEGVLVLCLVLEGNEMKIRTNINFPILVSEERGKKEGRM